MATAASPTDSEAAGPVDCGWNLPTDAFVDILLRLTPIYRSRVRLVCRHWRDVIDERTPRTHLRPPKVLAFFTSRRSASAVVIDDLSGQREAREVWGVGTAPRTEMDITMVGTCNGLLCLCDNKQPGGAVKLLNPATGEKLRLPPLPVSYHGSHRSHRSWELYSFGYDLTTGLYKILHLPCREDATGGFNVLQAFTLGDPDASWRDVAVPGGSSCFPDAGLVSIAANTYWVTNSVERVVCFNLKDEHVAFDVPLAVGAGPRRSTKRYQLHLTEVELHLTEVDGRLGLVVRTGMRTPVTTEEVWVLGDGGDRQGWTRRYSVQVHGHGVELWQRQRLAAPYFAADGGEYVLASRSDEKCRKHLHAHRLREAGIWSPRGEVRSVRISEPGKVVAYCERGRGNFNDLRTFAYVETMEPLSPYKSPHRGSSYQQMN